MPGKQIEKLGVEKRKTERWKVRQGKRGETATGGIERGDEDKDNRGGGGEQ